MLAVCLVGFRLIGLFFTAQREKKASWTTFRLLAKTRDLSDPQINVPAISSAPGPDQKTAQDTRLHTTLRQGRAKGTRADRVFGKPNAANRLNPQKARIEQGALDGELG